MATANMSQNVTAGPSKHDLLLLALGEGKHVEFTFHELGKRKVTITSVARFEDSRDGVRWWVQGSIVLSQNPPQRQNFEGTFYTQKRTGRFYFSAACGVCGHTLDENGECQPCYYESCCATCCQPPGNCQCFS